MRKISPSAASRTGTLRSRTAAKAAGNEVLRRLLRAAPELQAQLELVELPAGRELITPGQQLTRVYFPLSGVAAVRVALDDGSRGEVATVGREGVVSAATWLGLKRSDEQVLQQIPGHAYRLPARDVVHAMEHHRAVRTLLNRYTAYALRAAHQNLLCNGVHSLAQRTSRWLLQTADRAGTGQLFVTHSQLAAALGVRRQSVSEVLESLNRSELIEAGYRRISVTRHSALQSEACECYARMRRWYREVLGSHPLWWGREVRSSAQR